MYHICYATKDCGCTGITVTANGINQALKKSNELIKKSKYYEKLKFSNGDPIVIYISNQDHVECV
jgi:hypothetical protein